MIICKPSRPQLTRWLLSPLLQSLHQTSLRVVKQVQATSRNLLLKYSQRALVRHLILLPLMFVLVSLLPACSKDTAPPSPVTVVAVVPKAYLLPCTGERPPTQQELVDARTQYPVYQKYAAEDAQWETYLKTLDPPSAEAIRAKIQESHDWEARFVLMTDKYAAQTDNLGLCNKRLTDIGIWNDKARAVGTAGSSP